MSTISELRARGETPTMDQILDALEAAERQTIDLEQLPLKKLQDTLEQNWQPEGSILLQNKSVTADKLAPLASWISAPAFQNGWVNAYAAPEPQAQYYKDPYGVIHLRGRIAGGASGTVAFTLPSDSRPLTTVVCPAGVAGGAGILYGAVLIVTDGRVFIYYAAGMVDVSIAGTAFRTDA